LLGLTAWDRRKRHLDAHPEILLRRRARRALRKERQLIRRAAKRGDLPSFVAAAVRALCIGSAPHFPAKPDALVGNDVVEFLTQNGTSQFSGGETIIRRFFAAMDASRFSIAPATTNELFGLHPQLEQVLERMEARL
jgi:hypothetical protein